MTVWHGSPHVFERFDLSKIGTGEGAQAYGHGMYTAQAPGVAKEYQKNLAQRQFQTPKGEVFEPRSSLKNPNVRATLDKTNGDIDAAIYRAKKLMESIPGTQGAEFAKADIPVLEQLKLAGGLIRPEGNLYKVDLPDTHIRRMLDWDAPLKDQPTPIRKLAKALGLDMNDLGGDLLAKVGKDEAGRKVLQDAGIRGIKYLDQTSRNASGWHITPPDQTVRGKWMVKSSDYNSKGMHFDTEEEAKKALKEQTSKATRNFVVFDPSHMTILERNQQAINK
jgi:hypothetical protein